MSDNIKSLGDLFGRAAEIKSDPDADARLATDNPALHRGLEKFAIMFASMYEIDPQAILSDLNGDSALATLIRRMVGDDFGGRGRDVQDFLLYSELLKAGLSPTEAFNMAVARASSPDIAGGPGRTISSEGMRKSLQRGKKKLSK